MFVTGLIQESNPDRLASLRSTATLAYLRRVERLAGRGEARECTLWFILGYAEALEEKGT